MSQGIESDWSNCSREPPNPWARISEIAAKVGVEPISGSETSATIVAIGADGNQYDVWSVISAVLDVVSGGTEKITEKTKSASGESV